MTAARMMPSAWSVNSPFQSGSARENFPAASRTGAVALRWVFDTHRNSLLGTYVLCAVEKSLQLMQPLFVGLAVDGLLKGAPASLFVFAVQFALWLLVARLRREHVGQVSVSLDADLQRRLSLAGYTTDGSRDACRAALQRKLTEFFASYVPLTIQTGCALLGSLLMIAWCDAALAPLCVGLLIPALLLNYAACHDSPSEGGGTFKLIGNCALAVLIAVLLLRLGTADAIRPGHVVAVVGYAAIFVWALRTLPALGGRGSLLCEIERKSRTAFRSTL